MSEVLLPCPFCSAPASIRPVARSWWKIVVDHPEACILSGRFDDAIVPQRDEDKAGLVEDWNTRAALTTHAGAAAAEPSDGDILRAAQANGASVVWEGDGAGVHFTTSSWANFCASLRATAPLAALTSAPAVPEALKWCAAALQAVVDSRGERGSITMCISGEKKTLEDVLDMADMALKGVQPGERGEGCKESGND